MSVCKKIQLSSKVICSSAMVGSPQEEYAVLADDGVYILALRALPDESSNELTVHISKIDSHSEVKEFEVGVDRALIQKDILTSGELSGDFLEVMMNRTLSPAIESLQSNRGFVSAAWSPLGGDPVGRRVLLAVTGDHRLCIFSRHSSTRRWKQVVAISDLFEDLMKGEEFLPAQERLDRSDIDKGNKVAQIKERTYLLAAINVVWSGLFDGPVAQSAGEPPRKKRKQTLARTNNDSSTQKIAFLVAAMKSGHLGIWKTKFPVTSQKDISFSELVDLRIGLTSALLWVELRDDNPGFLVVGYQDGLIKFLPLKWLDSSADVTADEKPIDIWREEDSVPIHCFCWDSERSILYVAKGPFLFAMLVEEKASGKPAVIKEEHLAVSPKLYINDIIIQGNSVWVSTADDLVVKVMVTLTKIKDISMSVVSQVEPIRDPCGPMYPWKNHGFVMSRNFAFVGVLSSPGWTYCHLETRKPLRLDLISRTTPDEAMDRLLRRGQEDLLTDYTDILAYLKQAYCSTGTFPDMFESLIKDKDDWKNLPLFEMKLLRFLLALEGAYCKRYTDRKEELTDSICTVTKLIMTVVVSNSLKTAKELMANGAPLSDTEKTWVSSMCDWLKGHAIEEEDASLAKNLAKKFGSGCKESCLICGEEIPFTEILRGSCSKGHSYRRCCQTLTLCQRVPYRVCDVCGALAAPQNTDYSVLKPLLTNTCSICDTTLSCP